MSEPAPGSTVPNRGEKRGHRRTRKRLTLAFDGHVTLDGLEIVCRSVPIGVALDLAVLAEEFSGEADAKAKRTAGLAMAREFVQLVEGWNQVDDDGAPVELTAEWLLAEYDPDEFTTILQTWQRASTGVAAGPLPGASGSGPPSVEASMPMEPLSSSQAS